MTTSAVEKTDIVSLETYREQKFNVLVPTATMQQISPFHRLRVEEVKIDPNPDTGDVFKVGSKKVGNAYEDVLILSKTALMKISNAAGIVWNWNETKAISATRDYVLYQAVGAFRKPSGEWLPLKASKEIDLTVIEEETYESNFEKAKKLANSQYENDRKKIEGMTIEQYATIQTKSNMIQWRKNKLMRAETGAMLRVIRDLLSIKQQYSPSELQKPFVVPHVDFSPDYTDPEVRKMVLNHGIQATASLFGNAATSQQQLPGQTNPAMSNDAFPDDEACYEVPYMSAEDSADIPSDTVESEIINEDNVQVNESSNTTGAPTCDFDGCSKQLSHKEADYSVIHYEKFLCFKHQKMSKKVSEQGGNVYANNA
jgi:hypothetical protein